MSALSEGAVFREAAERLAAEAADGRCSTPERRRARDVARALGDGLSGRGASVRLLVCGSSRRPRGAGGWTDETWLDGVLRTLQPTLLAHGASPSGGGDAVAEWCGERHFRERGLDPDEHIRRFAMDPRIDGEGGRAFMRRNARMGETFFAGWPALAARPGAFIPLGIALCVGGVGEKVGSRDCYLSNGTDNMVRWMRAHRIPVVVRRENGVELARFGPPTAEPLTVALDVLRKLYAATQDKRLVAPGKALASLCECGDPEPDEVAIALLYAAEGSRWAPWIEAVAATVGASVAR